MTVITVRARLSLSPDGRLQLRCPFDFNDRARSVAGRSWNGAAKCWEYPALRQTVEQIATALPGVELDDAVRTLYGPPTPADHDAQPDWRAGPVEPIEPMPIAVQPYAHQVAGFNHGLRHRHFALFMAMRTGKSLTLLAVFGRRFERGEVARILIVAPTPVVPEWVRQTAEFAAYPHAVLDLSAGTIAARAERLRVWRPPTSHCAIAIVNIDALGAASAEPLVKALVEWRADAMAVDESQRIKNHRAQRTKAIRLIGRNAQYRAILTGTPVTQSPVDFFSQYSFLDPAILGWSFVQFAARYVIRGGFNGRQIVGYRDLADLTERVHSCAFRVRLEDTCDMPPDVDQNRYCRLGPAAARLYRDLAEESAALLASGAEITVDNVLTRLLRLQQIAGGFVPIDSPDGRVDQNVDGAKLALLGETLDDLFEERPDRKVVVFARFRAEIAAIEQLLRQTGRAFVTLQGGSDAGAVVRQFRADPAVRCFVGQIQAAGVGIPLDVADAAVYYSTTFSSADYEQARARIRAVGIATPRLHLHLLAAGTVDEHVQRALRHKRNVAEDVVDRWRELFQMPGVVAASRERVRTPAGATRASE